MPITLGTVGSAAKTLTREAFQKGVGAGRDEVARSAGGFVEKETEKALNQAGRQTVKVLAMVGGKPLSLLKSIGKSIAATAQKSAKGVAGKLRF